MNENAERRDGLAAEYRIQPPDLRDIHSPENVQVQSESTTKPRTNELKLSDQRAGQPFFLGLDGASFIRYSRLAEIAEEGSTTG